MTNIRYDQDIIWKTFECWSLQNTTRALKLLLFHRENFQRDWIFFIVRKGFLWWPATKKNYDRYVKKKTPKASKIYDGALSQNMANLQIPNNHRKLTLLKTIKTPQLKAFGEVSNFRHNLWLAHNQKTWLVLLFLETHWLLWNEFWSLTLTSWGPLPKEWR